MPQQPDDEVIELALTGDLTENQAHLCQSLLEVKPGGQCILYFDSLGGSPYCAIALATLILVRDLHATALVAGECSSAALLPFAACRRRLVTPYSVLLFHPMRWQSEENVGVAEAAEWSRHFKNLEAEMDTFLAGLLGIDVEILRSWCRPGRYLTGREAAEAGLAELIDLKPLDLLRRLRKGRTR